METPGLSFEQAPAVALPMRFFLAAPMFLALAGLALMHSHALVFASRWSGAALAVTHLLTAGFMLQIMVGALIQVLPVAGGGTLSRPAIIGALVFPALLAGALGLCAAFAWGWAPGYWLAIAGLGGGVSVFLVIAASALWRSVARGASVLGLRLACVGLGVTVALGVMLVLARLGEADAGWMAHVPLHIGWGLAGWALMLLMAVAWLVLPMFLMTRVFAPRITAVLAPAVFAGLLGMAVLPDWRMPVVLLALVTIGFSTWILHALATRRRRAGSALLRFWLTAVGGLAAAAVLVLADAAGARFAAMPMVFGILALGAGLCSVLIGMLYRIVPFILWLSLRSSGLRAPSMGTLLSEEAQSWHYRIHLAMLICLLPAPWWSEFAIASGALMLCSASVLLYNLAIAWRRTKPVSVR